MPSSSAAVSRAASTDALISSLWSITPRAVATATTVMRPIRPRTTRPAARAGLSLRRSSFPTSGLKTTARTAAKSSGSTISLTAASAVTTMIVATTHPTKLQAHAPILGTEPLITGRRCPIHGRSTSCRQGDFASQAAA